MVESANLLSNAVNAIFTLLLALIPTAYPFDQIPALVGQEKERLPVSSRDLRNAPTEVVLDGRALSLSSYLWRDFMPANPPDGRPMIAVLKVATSNQKPFPVGVRIDRAWVLFGEQIWEVSDLRGRVKGHPYNEDSWINCTDSPVCEAIARDGPKWGPGVYVDVVVQLTEKEGRHHLLQARNQYVKRTD
jgi:hypothetical protein